MGVVADILAFLCVFAVGCIARAVVWRYARKKRKSTWKGRKRF